MGNAAAGPNSFESWTQTGTVQDPSLTEISGVVASRRNSGVLWVHNDSGSAQVSALNEAGVLLGTYSISGATIFDWEDIAIATDPVDGYDYLFIGDIGDNAEVRTSIKVFKVREPEVDINVTGVVSNLALSAAYTLQYVDGPRDAEAMLVDPFNSDLYIVSKRDNPGRIYHVAYPLTTSGTNQLQFDGVMTESTLVGGDISPSGLEILIKGYFTIYYWCRSAGEPLSTTLTNAPGIAPYRFELQGEAIGWKGDGNGYYTIAEGSLRPIYFWDASDTDGDWLTDSEEFTLGTNPNLLDTDLDGQTDGQESIAGVDPNDPESYFAVASVRSFASEMELSWEALSDRLYDIDRTPDFVTFETLRSNLAFAVDGMVSTNLPVLGNQDTYRLRVRKAP